MENYEKKYKEALKRAKYLKENTDSVGAKDISYTFEEIFPELRESEDEKIRKALIRNFTNQHSSNFPTADGFTRDQILAWLEKQDNHNEQNFWEKCNHCTYFDGYDLCLHKKNFGSVTNESKENCGKNNFFIEKQGEQKSAVWSKEDEYVFDKIIHWVELVNPTSSIFEKLPKEQFIEKLKSLKDKIQI